MSDPIQQFRDALAGRGIIAPARLLPDGKLHRCDAEGRGGQGDAAYLLHLDGIPAGGFENWRDGRGWENWRADIGRTLTVEERAANRAIMDAARREREAEKARRHAEARNKADRLWAEAGPAPADHPYLVRKGVKPHGIRLHSRDRLIVPLRSASGALHSLQFIAPDGTKRFLPGGQTAGCYYVIGNPTEGLCVAEGYATAASIREATGHAVAIAFDAGNLRLVAEALRAKFPDLRMIACGDDDYRTEGNPGMTKATEAARAVGGLLACPDFGTERPDDATDFNDLHQVKGLDAVRRCIEAAVAPDDVPQPDAVDASPGQYSYGNGHFDVTEEGVFFTSANTDGQEQPPLWICSKLRIVAMTRDAKSGAWGRLLEWSDADRVPHRWAMPMELLQGDGNDLRRELARLGLAIAPGKRARDHLASYLQLWPVEARARCVERLGWHAGAYVTPIEAIGEAGERVVFQNAHALEPALSVAGTVDEWRDGVAALADGNSRLVFAISVAFASPLLEIVGEDSGGFHLRGASSSGKTTALKAGASVWGDPSTYPRLWRATANGLEGLAALHNDGLLVLDELSQIDPREAGEAAYLLANGQGKARASRSGTARQSARWRMLFLSAGEESLTALMAKAGRRANPGQEIRLADIDADAGAGMGAFEALNGQPSAASLAMAIKEAATRNHGAVGMEWLRFIVADRLKLAELIADGIRQFVKGALPVGAAGQVERVARRFGIVAVAGELATHYGLTGWCKNEATEAARKCFTAWLESFGGAGNREERAMLAQVRAFFEAHGASRFEDIAATGVSRVMNRVGFYKAADGEREFYVLPESFRREICDGFDAKAVTRALLAAGWLVPGTDGKSTQKPRLPGLGPTRCYVFGPAMWADPK